MGDRHVHPRLLSVRNSDGHDGRPTRSAARADAHRGVVVGVHGPDRRNHRLLPVAARQVPVRGRRSRCLSECVSGGLAMVPAPAARHDLRREPDGQPGGRRHRAVAGTANPDALRLANVVFRIRRGRADLGGGLVRLVPRFARREAGTRLAPIHRRRCHVCRPCVPVAPGQPFHNRVVDSGPGVLLRLRLHLLPDVVSYVPRPGSWIQRGQPAALGAAVRGRRVRQTSAGAPRATRWCGDSVRSAAGGSLALFR